MLQSLNWYFRVLCTLFPALIFFFVFFYLLGKTRFSFDADESPGGDAASGDMELQFDLGFDGDEGGGENSSSTSPDKASAAKPAKSRKRRERKKKREKVCFHFVLYGLLYSKK